VVNFECVESVFDGLWSSSSEFGFVCVVVVGLGGEIVGGGAVGVGDEVESVVRLGVGVAVGDVVGA
jgi:hypothetical protein